MKVPTIFGSFPSGVIYFGTYESMKRLLLQHSTFLQEHKNFAYMLAGSSAEFMGSLVFVPSELIKCRFQTNTISDTQMQQSTLKTFYQVAKSEGIRGLFRGYSATMIRDIPYSMTQFLIYEVLKKTVLKRRKDQIRKELLLEERSKTHTEIENLVNSQVKKLSVLESILVGGSAGGAAACLSNPFDVVKTRMQTSLSYRGGFLSMVKKVMSEEGIHGFFKGVTPRILWVTMSTGIMFSVFEFVSHHLTEMCVEQEMTNKMN